MTSFCCSKMLSLFHRCVRFLKCMVVRRVLCCWILGTFLGLYNTQAQGNSDKEQLQKLLDLETKNLEFLEKYSDKPSIQIKIKSNLVIIRLKIKALAGPHEDASQEKGK